MHMEVGYVPMGLGGWTGTSSEHGLFFAGL